jgi:hypothetical protein
MSQRTLDCRNAARVERWFAEIWNSDEKYPISLNSVGPHGGPVWEWLGWSRKNNAWKKYQSSIPASDFALLADSGNLLQLEQVCSGLTFDVLLTANGFDHALLGAPGEHGQRFRQLFIDIKNKVWEARQLKARGHARRMKAGAQSMVNAMAELGNGSPIKDSVLGCRATFGETPADMRILAEAATGVKVGCHSDALTVQSLGLEFQRLGRQISFGENAWQAGQKVVQEAKSKGWETECRFTQKDARRYEVVTPRFDAGRAMTTRQAKRLEGKSVVDIVSPVRAIDPAQQGSLF